MKLSTAIREGSKDTLPAKGDILKIEGEWIYACAFGAALYAKIGLEAMLNKDNLSLDDMLDIHFPEVANIVVERENEWDSLSLWQIVTRMNDKGGKSREAIADYVEWLGY